MSIINKTNYVLGRVFAVFLMVYASYSIGFTEIRPAEYIVKINDVPIYSDSANRILEIIKGERESVCVYDNVNSKEICISTTEENMNITIVGNTLIEKTSKLYNNCISENGIDGNVSLLYENEVVKSVCLVDDSIEMHMWVNKKSGFILNIVVYQRDL